MSSPDSDAEEEVRLAYVRNLIKQGQVVDDLADLLCVLCGTKPPVKEDVQDEWYETELETEL